MAPRISSSYGPSLPFAPPGHVIPTRADDCMAFAARVDREADAQLAAGRFHQAERLSHPALEARTRATGGRA